LAWRLGAGAGIRNLPTFSRSDFTFDPERNIYICPAGKVLKTTGNVGDDHTRATLRPARLRCMPTQTAMLSENASKAVKVVLSIRLSPIYHDAI